MITWGILKKQILTGILKDATGTKFSGEALLYYARGACTEIAFHTAEAFTYTYLCDGGTYQFPLPDDMVDGIEETGRVGWFANGKTEFLPNLRLEPGSLWPLPTSPKPPSGVQLATQASGRDYPTTTTTYKTPGFWEYPSGVLTLSFIPSDTDQIQLQYFRIWVPPVDDESILHFPVWMEKPFAYIVAAAAMDPAIISSTNIRQFNDRTQSGSPMDNPPMQQAKYFIAQAQRLLTMHRVQQRETYYKFSQGLN